MLISLQSLWRYFVFNFMFTVVKNLALNKKKRMVSICLYCLNCTQFGELILAKIITVVTTRCQILRLQCTKFDFGWGSAPGPAGRAYSASPAGFKGPTSKERGEEGWGGDRMGGKEDPEHSPSSKFATTPVFRAHWICKKTEIDIWKSWMPQWI